jgi:hypothetical protein
MSQVLPVFFEALPLKQDFAESSKCFEALFDLIQMSHPLVRTHFDHILAVFAHVLQNSVPAVPEEKAMIPAETREQLVAVLRVSLRMLVVITASFSVIGSLIFFFWDV